MVDQFMYIPNDDKPNYPYCKFQIVVERLNTSIKIHLKSPKLLRTSNKKTLL